MVENKYAANTEDISKIEALCGVRADNTRTDTQWVNAGDDDCYMPMPVMPDEEIKQLLHEMGEAAFSEDADAFAWFVEENKQRIRNAAFFSNDVIDVLVLGYKVGISDGSSACMNDLGAFYYRGDLVEQDYVKAAELYEMAMQHGCLQSVINLGYIWEYGRTGKKDYAKAFEYYSLAASLSNSSEAVYKLGDMYSRGKFVEKDMAKAYQLWKRSYKLACGVVATAQPAIRIAQLLMSDKCEEAHVEPDAMSALHLFQEAEIGLREDIADGQTYYAKRLQEAIEGQEKAREILDVRVMCGGIERRI